MATGILAEKRPLRSFRSSSAQVPKTIPCALLDKLMPQIPAGVERKQSIISDSRLLPLQEVFMQNYDKAASSIEGLIKEGNSPNKLGFTPWQYAIVPLKDSFASISQKNRETQPAYAAWTRYGPRTIELFSLTLQNYESFKLFNVVPSIFISWLVHVGRHRDYTLRVDATGASMEYLCETNWKSVRVFGDVGDHFAHNSRGIITVHGSIGNNAAKEFGGRLLTMNYPAILNIHGDAGDKLGSSCSNCTITLDGSSGKYAGEYMGNGAKIIIKGDAGENLGSCMFGGEIYVRGKIKSLGSGFLGGSIYQNGRQLVDNGKVVAQPSNL